MPAYPVNGPCDALYPQETLVSMRTRLIRRLGFSAQALNPPPGMKELMDDFLQEAQLLVYSDYAIFRTKRFFEWVLVAGERFYAYEDGGDGLCTKTVDPEKILWVGISQDTTNTGAGWWQQLIKGINPVWYGAPGASTGWPSFYELGQYIEVYPAPTSSGGLLRVEGNFNLGPFIADTDKTTADPTTIFLRALTNAKFHYKQSDAGNYHAQELIRVMNLIAASHATARYIPIPDAGRIWGCSGDNTTGISGPWGTRWTNAGDTRTINP